jgi:hypothetical protein
MALINPPPATAVDTQGPRGLLVAVSEGWRNFFVAAYNIMIALTGSGTTAQRPTAFIYIGRPFFDTTLGLPIWVQSTNPTVWVDATGAVV